MQILYQSKLNAGDKVPNENQTLDEVLDRLKLRGLTTARSIIRMVAKEDEFKKLREPSGVRHNNKGMPRRRRRGD
jgi:hypothetical protein